MFYTSFHNQQIHLEAPVDNVPDIYIVNTLQNKHLNYGHLIYHWNQI